MQTNDNQNQSASLASRFGHVRSYFQDHGLRSYLTVFKALGVEVTEDEAKRLYMLWNSRAKVKEQDADMVASMERAVERLKAA